MRQATDARSVSCAVRRAGIDDGPETVTDSDGRAIHGLTARRDSDRSNRGGSCGDSEVYPISGAERTESPRLAVRSIACGLDLEAVSTQGIDCQGIVPIRI